MVTLNDLRPEALKIDAIIPQSAGSYRYRTLTHPAWVGRLFGGEARAFLDQRFSGENGL